MTDALGAGKGERTAARLGCRSGSYTRTLVTRKYPLFVIANFAAAANRKSRSATELYSDQWPSGGGGSCPRFSLSRTAKIEFCLKRTMSGNSTPS